MSGEHVLDTLVRQLDPYLHAAEHVFTTVDGPPSTVVNPVATVQEEEGTTLVLPRSEADAAELPYDYVAARITLCVHSTLDAVGLSAAVSTALAEAGLSCNIMAGYYHDHLFVPAKHAQRAMGVLHELAGISEQSRPQ